MGTSNPYDEVLYTGYPFPQTHPDRLATLATLFGMKPTPVKSCRVLELGCGDGANLIPMAFAHPGSEFVGVDLAARPLAKGTAVIEALGIGNVTLHQLDVLDLSSDFGQFDYIIAHGLYSWVPPAVQDKVLAICKLNLALQGVAFVSYNTYPGGHLRKMAREMMLFHVRDLTDPRERLSQARGFIKSLSESHAGSDAYKIFFEQELDRILTRADEALYHDDLAEINAPIYFYQFMERAAGHGLQYLTEARLAESQTSIVPPQATQAPNPLGDDVVAKEQYFDFLKCRMFRQTLLCHADVVLDRSLNPERVREFYVASSSRPVSAQPDVTSPSVVEQFRVSIGATISADHPLAKAVLLELGEFWPRSVSFDELVHKARALVGGGNQRQEAEPLAEEEFSLCRLLLTLYGSDLVEFGTCLPSFVTVASERPTVSPLVRLQAQRGSSLTTLRHTVVEVKDDLARTLLMLLDGRRDRAALLRDLSEAVESRDGAIKGDRSQGGFPPRPCKITPEDLEQKLSELARLALLVA